MLGTLGGVELDSQRPLQALAGPVGQPLGDDDMRHRGQHRDVGDDLDLAAIIGGKRRLALRVAHVTANQCRRHPCSPEGVRHIAGMVDGGAEDHRLAVAARLRAEGQSPVIDGPHGDRVTLDMVEALTLATALARKAGAL